MGSPTSDDDPTRRVGGSGGEGPPAPGQRGAPYPGAPYPGPPSPRPRDGPAPPWPGQGPAYLPPGQGGNSPPPDLPTTRFAQPEGQRGQTARFPQPGGYPPGGPGAPWPPQGPPGAYGYAGPPGGQPPGASRRGRGLVVALVAGLVLLAGVAVALVVALATRNDGDRVSADPSSPPSAVPTPSSSEPGPEQSSSSAPSSPTESAGDRTDELLAVLPPDFADCTGTDLAGDGDVAAVTCGPGATQPGPQGAEFYLYDDTSTLDRVFVEDVEDAGIEEMPAGEDCSTAQGVTTWNGADDTEGGTVACAITDEGLLIAWTDREFGVEGVVTAPGSTQEELAELAAWWRTNSDFQR